MKSLGCRGERHHAEQHTGISPYQAAAVLVFSQRLPRFGQEQQACGVASGEDLQAELIQACEHDVGVLEFSQSVLVRLIQPPAPIRRSAHHDMNGVRRAGGRCCTVLKVKAKMRRGRAAGSAGGPEKSAELFIVNHPEGPVSGACIEDFAERAVQGLCLRRQLMNFSDSPVDRRVSLGR
ncbi:hypothetical protein KKK_25590 [Pseudomonas putida B6-2]|nr:hypothetical protein KKK_25590 [Pseudomonas putida B6-2]